MRLALRFTVAAGLLGLVQAPAQATSCAEQIGTIERRLDSAGAIQVTGPQDGRSLRLGSPRALTVAYSGEPSDPEMISTALHIAEARQLIRRAAAEDRGGHQRACENTMTEAKGMIGALP